MLTKTQENFSNLSALIQEVPTSSQIPAAPVKDKGQILKFAAEKLEESACKLSKYLEEIKSLQLDKQELQRKVDDLEKELESIHKKAAAEEIVDDMIEKNMVSALNKEQKMSELLAMEDSALEQLKQAVSAVERVDEEKYGISSLQYLMDSDIIQTKKTMLEEFSSNN